MGFPAGQHHEAQLFGSYVVRKTVEFVEGTTGAVGNHDIFTVSAPVHAVVVAYCTEDLVGASATISLGTASSVACLIAVTTAENIDTGEIWFDDTPADCVSQSSIGGAWLYDNISYDVLVAAISDGTLTFVCYWTPMAANATVTAV